MPPEEDMKGLKLHLWGVVQIQHLEHRQPRAALLDMLQPLYLFNQVFMAVDCFIAYVVWQPLVEADGVLKTPVGTGHT
jgi:hypothetical protein